jgi:hypothetical protein
MSTTAARDRRSTFDLWLVLLFLAAIAAPSVDMAIRRDAARSPEKTEQRTPAPFPPLTYRSLVSRSWPDRFTKYFDDAFGLRDVLLRWNSIEKLFVFGVSAASHAILGRDRWTFYLHDDSMAIFRGVHPFTDAELERWRVALETRRNYLAQRNIEFVFVLGPNKETIYPDYMPACENRVGPTRMDQLVAYLAEHSDFRIVDLRPALLAARKDDRPYDHLYYELGTHWNGRGGYVAAIELQKYLHERFPAVRVFEPSEVEIALSPDSGDSDATRMYVDDLLPQKHWYIQLTGASRHRVTSTGWSPHRTELDDPALPTLLVFHDSFGPSTEPILTENFRRTTWSGGSEFDTDLIERTQPDVVMDFYVERVLSHGDLLLAAGTARVRAANPRGHRGALQACFRFEPPDGAAMIQTRGSTVIGRGKDGDGEYVSIETLRDGDTCFLPEFRWPPDGFALVRVEMTTPTPTTFTLFYLAAGQTEYDRQHAVSAELAQGLNRFTLTIDDTGIHGPLMIRPGVELERYLLRSVEVLGSSTASH